MPECDYNPGTTTSGHTQGRGPRCDQDPDTTSTPVQLRQPDTTTNRDSCATTTLRRLQNGTPKVRAPVRPRSRYDYKTRHRCDLDTTTNRDTCKTTNRDPGETTTIIITELPGQGSPVRLPPARLRPVRLRPVRLRPVRLRPPGTLATATMTLLHMSR